MHTNKRIGELGCSTTSSSPEAHLNTFLRFSSITLRIPLFGAKLNDHINEVHFINNLKGYPRPHSLGAIWISDRLK